MGQGIVSTEARAVSAILAPALVGMLWSAACSEAPAADPPGSELPNIVLISIDTLRADRLGAWGYARGTSPELDAFAREAVRFSRAIGQAPTTAPAHMSIFTGLLPAVHRTSNINEGAPQALDPAVTTFTELLRDAGYYTAGFHGGGNVDGSLGFARGFDFYSQDYVSYNWMGAYRDPADLDAIRPWLRVARSRGRPLFLFLHHFVCHSPYVSAPDAFRDRFLAGRAVEGLPIGAGDEEKTRMVALLDRRTGGRSRLLAQWRLFRDKHDRFWDGVDLSRKDHRGHVEALYDAQVAYSDWLFGRVRRVLTEEGAFDGSLIVVLSDHGEEFGEHGQIAWHSHTLYDELLRVVLLVKLPGSRHAGRTEGAQVRGIDLAPTILAAAGVPPPAAFEGTSLLRLLDGGPPPPQAAVAAYDGGHLSALRVPGWKLNDRRLFDLAADPGETRNVVASHPEKARELRERKQRLIASRPLPKPAPVAPDETTLEQLRALGYLGASVDTPH
jgi:arylsulfatase A-like enzyme